MSLKLDLLLEAIEEVDRCEANGEVLTEAFDAHRAKSAIKKDLKAAKKEDKDEFKAFFNGKMEADKANDFYKKWIEKIDSLLNAINNTPKDQVSDSVANTIVAFYKTALVGSAIALPILGAGIGLTAAGAAAGRSLVAAGSIGSAAASVGSYVNGGVTIAKEIKEGKVTVSKIKKNVLNLKTKIVAAYNKYYKSAAVEKPVEKVAETPAE